MSVVATYAPGDSWLHRLPAGAKLVGVVVVGAASIFVRTPVVALAAVAVVTGLCLSTRVPVPLLARPLRSLWPFLVAIGGYQWWVSGWPQAVTVIGVILTLALASTLVAVTTRMTAMLDALTTGLRPFRRLGVDPDRVALQLALGIRAVPVVIGLAQTVREAQHARGLSWSVRAFAVPTLVRAIRHADTMGDALRARGFDD